MGEESAVIKWKHKEADISLSTFSARVCLLLQGENNTCFLLQHIQSRHTQPFNKALLKWEGMGAKHTQTINWWKHHCRWVNRPQNQAALTLKSVIQSPNSLEVHLSTCTYHLDVKLMMGPTVAGRIKYADGWRDTSTISGHLDLCTSWNAFSCLLSCQPCTVSHRLPCSFLHHLPLRHSANPSFIHPYAESGYIHNTAVKAESGDSTFTVKLWEVRVIPSITYNEPCVFAVDIQGCNGDVLSMKILNSPENCDAGWLRSNALFWLDWRQKKILAFSNIFFSEFWEKCKTPRRRT